MSGNSYSTRPIVPIPVTTSRDTQPTLIGYQRYHNPIPYPSQQGYVAPNQPLSGSDYQMPPAYTPQVYNEGLETYGQFQAPFLEETRNEDGYDSETVKYPRISESELNSKRHSRTRHNSSHPLPDQGMFSRKIQVTHSLGHDGFPVIVPKPQQGSANHIYQNILGYTEPISPSHPTAHTSRNNTMRSKSCLNCNDPACVHKCWENCAIAESASSSNSFQNVLQKMGTMRSGLVTSGTTGRKSSDSKSSKYTR